MKHFIIVKFNDEVDKEKIKEPIRDLFSKALKIAGIKNVDIYNSNSDLANRHDMMIEMNLSEEALDMFDKSEIHREWKEKYGECIINKTIFDCD